MEKGGDCQGMHHYSPHLVAGGMHVANMHAYMHVNYALRWSVNTVSYYNYYMNQVLGNIESTICIILVQAQL